MILSQIQCIFLSFCIVRERETHVGGQRERKKGKERERQKERDRKTERDPSRLHTVKVESDGGLELTTVRS